MEKKLLLAATLFGAALMPAEAQNYEYYEFTNDVWIDDNGDSNVPVGVFHKVSANGRYAVGCDDILITGAAYYWDAEDSEVLNYIVDGYNRYGLYDVANDGTMVGLFEDREDLEVMSICYPGYYTVENGWTQLPVPDNYSTYYNTQTDYVTTARAITPDAQYIIGHYYATTGYKETIFGNTEKVNLLPIVWRKTDTGYVIDKVYTDMKENGYNYVEGELVKAEPERINWQNFFVYDVSNDGKTIVGYNLADAGGFNPAIIRDGKLIQLFECGFETDDDRNFNGGICNSIDANGNIYGYYQLADGSGKYFTYTNDGKLVFNQQFNMCADKDGNLVTLNFDGLSNAQDCSEDGSLIAGGCPLVTEFGVLNAPALLWDSNRYTSAIERPNANNTKIAIDYRCGELFVDGVYHEASIYDASGKLIDSGRQGKSFNMNKLPAGVYIVKVNSAEGTQSFKLNR